MSLIKKMGLGLRKIYIKTIKKLNSIKGTPKSIAKGFAKYEPQKDTNFIDVFNRADDAMYDNKREMKGLK